MQKLFLFTILVCFLWYTPVDAQSYTLLEKIPFATGASTMPEYFESIYNFLIGVVGLSAVLMIMIGGVWYVTSAGNQARAQTAKTVVGDAVFGLMVVLLAWVVLNVINPRILDGGLLAPRIENVNIDESGDPVELCIAGCSRPTQGRQGATLYANCVASCKSGG